MLLCIYGIRAAGRRSLASSSLIQRVPYSSNYKYKDIYKYNNTNTQLKIPKHTRQGPLVSSNLYNIQRVPFCASYKCKLFTKTQIQKYQNTQIQFQHSTSSLIQREHDCNLLFNGGILLPFNLQPKC